MQSISRFIYGPSPEEKVKKWQQQLRSQQRQLERDQRQLAQAQDKTRAQLKQLAQKGQVKDARRLAREVVLSQKAATRLATSKAMLNSIHMQLSNQLATLKVTGTLQSSTEILKMTNSLVKLPELSASMRDMSAEMSKAGIMDDMIDDVMGDTEDLDEEEEQEAEGEVDKVLFDITNGKMGAVESASANLPELQSQKKEREQPSQEELEAEERENKRMQEQLNQLLSGQ